MCRPCYEIVCAEEERQLRAALAATVDVLAAHPASYDADRAESTPAPCIVCADDRHAATVPCCGATVCRECLATAAEAMGALFACPACRDRDAFRGHAARLAVATHELEPDYVTTGEAAAATRFCSSEKCECPSGPGFDACHAVPKSKRNVPF